MLIILNLLEYHCSAFLLKDRVLYDVRMYVYELVYQNKHSLERVSTGVCLRDTRTVITASTFVFTAVAAA